MFDPAATLDELESDMWSSLYRCRYDRDHRIATVHVLARLLADEDVSIRQRALRAVSRIGPCDTPGALAELVPLLCADLRHEDDLTRRTAASALFAVGADAPKAAVPALIDACSDDVLLDTALQALVEIGQSAKSAAPCFRSFATHRNGKIRRLAVRGLGAIEAADAKSRAVLDAALSDPNKSVREMARKVISRRNSGA